MQRKSTKTKAVVAVRSSKRLIERASSPTAPAEVAVGETPTKRKAGGAPAGAPGLKVRDFRSMPTCSTLLTTTQRVRASPHACANAKTKILAAQTALKNLELSVGKTGVSFPTWHSVKRHATAEGTCIQGLQVRFALSQSSFIIMNNATFALRSIERKLTEIA